jgi:hypothetical protein
LSMAKLASESWLVLPWVTLGSMANVAMMMLKVNVNVNYITLA